MNGVHDMGGQQGFGPVLLEEKEPLFHAPWESRAMAITVAMGASGQWNIDLSRAARESLPPAIYLSSSYYEIWIRALEKLMLERGMVTQAELTSGEQSTPPVPVSKVLNKESVDAALKAGSPTERPIDQPAFVQSWPKSSRAQHAPTGPHPITAVCARPCRHRGQFAWRSCVSRWPHLARLTAVQCACAVALHRGL
jgi:hypothetical protein